MSPAIEVHGEPLLFEGLERQPGQVIDVSAETAERLLESGQAVKPGKQPSSRGRRGKQDAEQEPEAPVQDPAPEPDGE